MSWRQLLTLWVSLLCLLSPVAAQDLNDAYSAEELTQLVAPVALYPDPLLATIAAASAYPEQIVQAQRFLQTGANNWGDQGWDESVVTLCNYSPVLEYLAGQLEWTQAFGWAAANNSDQLTDAIQDYRRRVQQAGNLDSNQQVLVRQEGETILIEPRSEKVYVPVYDPLQIVTVNRTPALIRWTAGAVIRYAAWKHVWDWRQRALCSYNPGSVYRPGGLIGVSRPWRPTGIVGVRPPRPPVRPRPPIRPPLRPGVPGQRPNRPNVGNPPQWRPQTPGVGSRPGGLPGRPPQYPYPGARPQQRPQPGVMQPRPSLQVQRERQRGVQSQSPRGGRPAGQGWPLAPGGAAGGNPRRPR